MRTVSKYSAVNLRRTMAILIVAVVFLTGLPGAGKARLVCRAAAGGISTAARDPAGS